jgi:tetratricopeptide (TPR) repeat protein
MAKPEYCPVLSTPPVFDEKTRALKSGMMVKCKGAACALFRARDETCALGVADPGSATTAIAQPVEDGDAILEAVSRLEQIVSGKENGLDARLDALRNDVRKDTHRFEEALADIVKSLNRVSGAMESFTRASRSFERLHEKLQREARTAEEKEQASSLYAEGVDHLRAGRVSQGIRALRRCLALGKAAPKGAAGALGAGLLMGGELTDAIVNLRHAAQEDETSPVPHANLAHAHSLAGNWAAAEKAAREAIRLDPRCAAAWNTLGNALYSQGTTPEAVAAWRTALETDPGLEPAWDNLKRQRIGGGADGEVVSAEEE